MQLMEDGEDGEDGIERQTGCMQLKEDGEDGIERQTGIDGQQQHSGLDGNQERPRERIWIVTVLRTWSKMTLCGHGLSSGCRRYSSIVSCDTERSSAASALVHRTKLLDSIQLRVNSAQIDTISFVVSA